MATPRKNYLDKFRTGASLSGTKFTPRKKTEVSSSPFSRMNTGSTANSTPSFAQPKITGGRTGGGGSFGGSTNTAPKTDFIKSLADKSPTFGQSSITPTSPTLSPAGQDFARSQQIQDIQDKANTIQSDFTDLKASQTQQTQDKSKTDPTYLKYLRSLENPTEASNIQKERDTALQNLANIESKREERDTEARRRYEEILDRSGGTRAGAVQGATQDRRRSETELADIALQQSAAARTAGVAQTAFQSEQERIASGRGETPSGFSLGKDQIRYEYDTETGGYKQVGQGIGSQQGGVGGSTTYTAGENQAVDSYVAGLKSGDLKFSDVPDELQNLVAQGLSSKGGAVSQGNREMVSMIDALLGNEGLAGITGGVQQFRPGVLMSDQQRLAKNQLDQLVGNLKLENRQKLKGSGTISDFEFRILGQAATTLGRNLGDQDTVDELQRLKDSLTGNLPIPETPLDGDLWKSPDGKEWEFVNGEWNDMNEGFNSVGNTTVSIPTTSRLASVNNNPGNLRFAGQTGATQGEGGFAKFSTPEAGAEALTNQIKLDAGRGLTLAQFISKYAPPSENDTERYIQDMIAMTGASADTALEQIDLQTLTRAVAMKESSTKLS